MSGQIDGFSYYYFKFDWVSGKKGTGSNLGDLFVIFSKINLLIIKVEKVNRLEKK